MKVIESELFAQPELGGKAATDYAGWFVNRLQATEEKKPSSVLVVGCHIPSMKKLERELGGTAIIGACRSAPSVQAAVDVGLQAFPIPGEGGLPALGMRFSHAFAFQVDYLEDLLPELRQVVEREAFLSVPLVEGGTKQWLRALMDRWDILQLFQDARFSALNLVVRPEGT